MPRGRAPRTRVPNLFAEAAGGDTVLIVEVAAHYCAVFHGRYDKVGRNDKTVGAKRSAHSSTLPLHCRHGPAVMTAVRPPSRPPGRRERHSVTTTFTQ